MVSIEKIKKVFIQTRHIFTFKKDLQNEKKVFIQFRSENIPGIDNVFAIYLIASNEDIILLHNLLKGMIDKDLLEIRFIANVYKQ